MNKFIYYGERNELHTNSFGKEEIITIVCITHFYMRNPFRLQTTRGHYRSGIKRLVIYNKRRYDILYCKWDGKLH